MKKRHRFEKAMEDLVVMAVDNNFRIVFDDISESIIFGWFEQNKRLIKVLYGENSSEDEILFVTAHEIRHMQHYILGIYKDYYRDEHEDALDIFSTTDKLPVGYVPPMPWVAIRAEADCNKWAKNFMKERGFNCEPEKYRIRSVMGYQAWMRYKATEREGNQKTSRNKGAAC